MAAMRLFLKDSPAGLKKGRYRPNKLPSLGIGNGEFDLALSSPFLFTYSVQLSLIFTSLLSRRCAEWCRSTHLPAAELRRVAVLLLHPVVSELYARGYRAETLRVPYEFQKGVNRLLSVAREVR